MVEGNDFMHLLYNIIICIVSHFDVAGARLQILLVVHISVTES